MKNTLKYLFPFLFLALPVCGQQFTIGGKIELDRGCLLVLTQTPEGMDTLSRTAFSGETFSLAGELAEPVIAHLVGEGYEGGFVMILEPGENYTATLTRNGQGDISGGKLQQTYLDYQAIVLRANGEMRALKQKMAEAGAQKHFKTVKELQEKANKVQQEAKGKMDALIRRNADNVLAAYLQTVGMERINELAPLKQMYASLSEKAKTTAPGRILAARIAAIEQVSVAAKAPDFTLPTPDGEQISLYGVKGKLKIIDFWASWCGPCRMENPNMVKLYNDFKNKGLAVISVSLDERKAAWTQAIKKDGMPWIHVSDLKGWKCEVVKLFNVDAVPYILVLDENNRILAKNIRAEKLRAFVEERLGK